MRIPGVRRLFRLPASEDVIARQVDDEIAFHLAERVDALVAEGSSNAEARRQAEREFGHVREARAELLTIDRVTLRRDRRADWWEALLQDVRLAWRVMLRNPAFTGSIVLMLALAIGVNAAMFGMTDRLLLSAPPHVSDAEQLYRVYSERDNGGESSLMPTLAYVDYLELQQGVRGFQEIAAYGIPQLVVLSEGGARAELKVQHATASFFRTLGVQPFAGRFFLPEDDAPTGERVLVLSHRMWRTHFGSDAAVIGRSIEIDNEKFEVIGVAPRGFNGIELETVDAWAPASLLGAQFGDDWRTWRGAHWLRLVARLAAGVSPDVAVQQATAVHSAGLAAMFPGSSARVVLGSSIAARAPVVGSANVQQSGASHCGCWACRSWCS